MRLKKLYSDLSHYILKKASDKLEVTITFYYIIVCTPPFLLEGGLNVLPNFQKGAGGFNRTSIFKERLPRKGFPFPGGSGVAIFS